MMLRTIIALLLSFSSSLFSLAQEPWAVMTGQSVVEVRAGLRYLYQRLGRKDLVAALDSAAVTNLLSGNLNGLDLHRPVGCLVLPNQQGTGSIITFIPSTGEQTFLEFLRRHLLTVGADEEGKPTVNIPLVGTLHIRFDQQYAWLAFSSNDLARSLPDLRQLIPQSHRTTQLATTIYLDRLPTDQRHQWLLHGQQGLDWLLKGSTQEKGQLTETLGIPMANLLMKRLAQDAKEVTILAHADRKADLLWGKIIVTPRPDVPWLAEVKKLAEQPVRFEVPASLWAKLRGKSEETATKAAQTAFKSGESDKLILAMQGGNQLELKAEMSGAMLAYHAALDQDGRPAKRLSRRERRGLPPR